MNFLDRNHPNFGKAATWLREVAVWSPWPELSEGGKPVPTWQTMDGCIEAIASALAYSFPPEAFSPDTVKRAAALTDTFPNYYWCCRALESAGFQWRNRP